MLCRGEEKCKSISLSRKIEPPEKTLIIIRIIKKKQYYVNHENCRERIAILIRIVLMSFREYPDPRLKNCARNDATDVRTDDVNVT